MRLNLTVAGFSEAPGAARSEWRLPGLPGAKPAPASWAVGAAAPRAPVDTGAPETGATPPNPRHHAPGDPPSRTPSAPSGGASTGSTSSAASGSSGSSASPMSMVLFAELGLATWALYVLLISAARWRSLTFTWLPERPG